LRAIVPVGFRDEIIILVGPEGGFTPQEEASCLENGFHPVKLGANILRVETAGLALIAGLLALHD
jgi:16S rRNA (uracil1498-N3)-methyltransferase